MMAYKGSSLEEVTAKDILKQVYLSDKLIDSKLEQLERLKSLAEKVTTSLTGQPKAATSKNHAEDVLIKLIDFNKEINEEIDRLVNLKKLIKSEIEKIPDIPCRLVLENRYLNYKTFSEIAIELNYTDRHVLRVHSKALASFEKISLDVIKCHVMSSLAVL